MDQSCNSATQSLLTMEDDLAGCLGDDSRLTEVTFEGFRIIVQHDDAAVARALCDRLHPYFGVKTLRREGVASLSSPRGELLLRVGCGSPPRPSAPPKRIMLRDHPSIARYRRPGSLWQDDSAVVVEDERSSTLFGFRPHQGSIAALGSDPAACGQACRRLIQDLIRGVAWNKGFALVEAAALLPAPDQGLLLVGESGAGKTSLLVRLLKTTHGAFVANDEVFLRRRPDHVIAIGAPVHVMVRQWLADRLPELQDVRAALTESGLEKEPMHYAEFAARLGVPLVHRCRVTAYLFVDRGVGIEKLSWEEAASALRNEFRWFEGWSTPWTEALREKRRIELLDLQNVARALTRPLPSYRVGRRTMAAKILAAVGH